MALANARNEVIHEGVLSVAHYAALSERPLSQYARWHEGSLFWVGERVLREAIKAHLGPEILPPGPLAKNKVLTDLIQAIRLEKDQDKPTDHEEDNVLASTELDHEQKPTAPLRSVAQLLTELDCQAANQVEISKTHGMPSASLEVARASSAEMMNMWGAETMDGRSLLISEPERDLLLAAGAEESIPDDWWDAGSGHSGPQRSLEAEASVEAVPVNTPGQTAMSLGVPPVVLGRAQHRIWASCPGGKQGSPVWGLTPASAEHSGGAAGYWYGLRAGSL